MATDNKLTAEEIAVIVNHVAPLLQGIEQSLDRLPKRDAPGTGDYIKNQRRYFTHVRAALRWVISTARQRRGAEANGGE